MNSIQLVGRLGKDPELTYTPNGDAMTKFTLAVDRESKEKETDWFFVTAYRKQAESASEYLSKGSLVGVVGRMQSWRKDQDSPTLWTVIADRIKFLSPKKSDNE